MKEKDGGELSSRTPKIKKVGNSRITAYTHRSGSDKGMERRDSDRAEIKT